MKALSLWQPWASLMADGRKKIETRHWQPPACLIGQELAIHATMHVDRTYCAAFGYDSLTIPRGCIVAIVTLDEIRKFTQSFEKEIIALASDPNYPEGNYGDFTMGRFGWFCTLVKKLNPPITVQGHQGIWNWEPKHGPEAS